MSLFTDLGLSPEVLKAIEEKGYTSPSPVQEKAIPALLSGVKDFVGLAQTGTGKTAAFGLPLIDVLDIKNPKTQGLVLAPTRELANQITKDLLSFAKYKHTKIVAVYGGANIQTQISQLKRGAQIVVATPGRLIDLLNRRCVDLSETNYVVLDEADEMLNMGFQDDINKILEGTPEDKVTWLFSATMPKEIRRISQQYMTDPFEITIGSANSSNENIEHHFYTVKGRDRYPALKRIVDISPDIFGIIFCRTKLETQRISDNLGRDGYNTDALHGDLSQAQRDRVMGNFKNKTLQILVATDVAARGIDVNEITHVINYGLPDDIESYTHRSGRTARAGKKGISLALVDPRDMSKVKQLERITKMSFEKKSVPSAEEVCNHQLTNSFEKITKVEVDDKKIEQFLPMINEAFADLTKEEIIQKIATAEVKKIFATSKSYDLNVSDSDFKRGKRDGAGGGYQERGRSDEDRIFINLGRSDGMKRKDILDLVVSASGVNSGAIGDIDDKGAYSFFQIKKDATQDVLNAFRDNDFKGKKVRVEITKDSGDGGRRGGNRNGGGGRRRFEGNRGGGGRRSNDFNSRGGEDRKSRGDRGGRSDRNSQSSNSRSDRERRGGRSGGNDVSLSDLFTEPSNF